MASSKVLEGDLPELTNFVLYNLRKDFNSLYSCILVNRFWCRMAIPLLWENPFSINFNNQNSHFLDIYLSSFQDDDKATLKKFDINRIESLTLKKSSFKYSSYIKIVDTYKIEMAVRDWVLKFITLVDEPSPLQENDSQAVTTQNIRPLTISPGLAISISTLSESAQSLVHAALSAIFNLNKPDSPKVKDAIQFTYITLFKLFIDSGATLNTFHFHIENLNNAIFENIYKVFLNSPRFISDIKNFTFGFRSTLHIDTLDQNYQTKIKPLLITLSSHCNFIKNIILEFSLNNHSQCSYDLATIIDSQKHLGSLTCSDVSSNSLYPLLSFNNSSNTLTSIKFRKCNFTQVIIPFDGLKNLNQLESIQFISCKGLKLNFIQPLLEISTPLNIKTLAIMNCEIDDDKTFFTPLFQKVGKSLENLFISFHKNYSKNLLEILLKYCDNIKLLYLTDISYSNIRQSFQLISFLNNTLKYLTINVKFVNWYDNELNDQYQRSLKISSKLLKRLGQELPLQLKYLNLSFVLVDSNDLQKFFQDSKDVKLEKFLIRTRNRDVNPILNVLQDFIVEKDSLEYVAYEKGSIDSIDDEVCYNGLEERIREIGSSVKVERYNELRIDTNYI